MSLVDRARSIHERLMNPPNAVDDEPIDLKRKHHERPTLALKIGPITPYLRKRLGPATEDITRIVCENFNVSPEDLQSHRRTQNLIWPRQVWAYLAKEMIELSYPRIGHYLGGRDHSTQIHSCDKVTGLVETNGAVAGEIKLLRIRVERLFSIRNSVVCFDLREI